MNDLEYLDRAEQLLRAVEECCDALSESTEVDLDNQRVGGMVTITFSNRSQIVVNLQKPLHEIWLAARDGGYHFVWREQEWQDTKNGAEFFATLSRCASAQSGQVLVFGPSS